MAPNIYQRQGIVRKKVEELNPEALYQQGFTKLVVGPSFLDRKNQWLIEEKKFEGRALVERVVTNPEIVVYRLTPPAEWQGGSTSRCVKDAEFWHCGGEEQEGHHWINKRREALKFEGSGGIVRSGFKFEVMSPWPGQVLRVSIGNKLVQEIRDLEPGTWASVSVGIPPEKSREDIRVEFEVTKIYAPASRGAGADLRRLGVGIRGLKLSF